MPYTFYNLFGGRSSWDWPADPLFISANGIEWKPPSRPTTTEAPDADEVRICREFLAACEQTKHPRIGSYGLKHTVEHAAQTYVSNGALLQAARELGIPFVVTEGNPNGILALSKRSIKTVKTNWANWANPARPARQLTVVHRADVRPDPGPPQERYRLNRGGKILTR